MSKRPLSLSLSLMSDQGPCRVLGTLATTPITEESLSMTGRGRRSFISQVLTSSELVESFKTIPCLPSNSNGAPVYSFSTSARHP